MPPTPEWPGATPRRKLEAGNCSPVWLPTPEAGSWKLDSRSQIRDKSQKTIVHRGQGLGGFIPELDRVFHLPELFQRALSWKLEDGKWRTKPSEAAAPPSVRKQQERPPPLLPSPKWQFRQVSATPAARRPWPPDVLHSRRSDVALVSNSSQCCAACLSAAREVAFVHGPSTCNLDQARRRSATSLRLHATLHRPLQRAHIAHAAAAGPGPAGLCTADVGA